MIVTLDHNCILSLEENRKDATILRELAGVCHQLDHTIAVYQYMPLENQPHDAPRRDFANFSARLQALRLGELYC
jgi:hypothetical protein